MSPPRDKIPRRRRICRYSGPSLFARPSFRGGILHFLPPPPNCNGPMGNIRVRKTMGGSILPPPSSFSSVDEGKKCLQPLLLFFSQKAATFSKGPNQGRRERKDRNRYIRATAAARKTDRGSLPSFSPNKIIQKASPPSPPTSFMGLQNCRIMRRRVEKKKEDGDRPTHSSSPSPRPKNAVRADGRTLPPFFFFHPFPSFLQQPQVASLCRSPVGGIRPTGPNQAAISRRFKQDPLGESPSCSQTCSPAP